MHKIVKRMIWYIISVEHKGFSISVYCCIWHWRCETVFIFPFELGSKVFSFKGQFQRRYFIRTCISEFITNFSSWCTLDIIWKQHHESNTEARGAICLRHHWTQILVLGGHLVWPRIFIYSLKCSALEVYNAGRYAELIRQANILLLYLFN